MKSEIFQDGIFFLLSGSAYIMRKNKLLIWGLFILIVECMYVYKAIGTLSQYFAVVDSISRNGDYGTGEAIKRVDFCEKIKGTGQILGQVR